ncbi:MAG: PP2C family serine/threonine-protein phosphatase [Pseudomonadota bacterium]
MKFSIFQESRIGGRALNEDRVGYRYTSDALVMVVADGLGGHGHGEIAAEAAVRSIIATFDRQAKPRLADPAHFLADALAGAHAAIRAQCGLRQLDDQPRTTCVACVIQDGIALWGHSGDSRLYLLRDNRVTAKTRDHSRVQALIDEGQLTPAGVREHPLRNILTSCLGGEQPPRFEFSARTVLERGDILLLCSDGVWGPLDDDAPLLTTLAGREAAKSAPALLDRVESVAGAGRDNLSLIVMVWGEEDRPATAETAPAQRAWTQEDFSRTINTTVTRLHAKDSQ